MRKIFLAMFILLSSICSGETYYVATNGSDSNPGTISQPWLTWNYAFDTAIAGDTVFYRGGVYYVTAYISTSNKSGTAENPICHFNYPGEIPILDGSNKVTTSTGMGFNNCNYFIVQGLTVRYNFQIAALTQPNGIETTGGNNLIFRNCTSHNNGYRGVYVYNPESVYFYNCDSYNNADTLSAAPGNAGDGFIVTGTHLVSDTTRRAYFDGCRSWHNSDDGWDVNIEGTVTVINCWAFRNGYLASGNGMGFKLSLSESQARGSCARIINNNVAFDNESSGFTTNDNGHLARRMNVFNNTAFRNGLYGYVIFNCDPASDNTEELVRVFKNNIAYSNSSGTVWATAGYNYYTHSNNSWDASPSVTVNNSDFVNVDTTGATATRQFNGSLPENAFYTGFLKLVESSDLVDAGTDVGLSYIGSFPDIGYSEYVAEGNILVEQITVAPQSGGAEITIYHGTKQLVATVLPFNATNQIVEWSVIGVHASINQTTGLLTAISDGSILAVATATDGSNVSGSLEVTISNQTLPVPSGNGNFRRTVNHWAKTIYHNRAK